MIFQEYALVERLTRDGERAERPARLCRVLGELRCGEFPQSDIDEAFRLLGSVGLDHMADKRADELSGGQRQRVGICRRARSES